MDSNIDSVLEYDIDKSQVNCYFGHYEFDKNILDFHKYATAKVSGPDSTQI